MPHPLTLSTLAVLAVAGTVGGVFLGRSAIAEINPAYYDEPETRFHADLVPNPPGFDGPSVRQAGYLTDGEAASALGTGCVNCLTYPEEYYPVHDSSVDKYQPGYAEMIETPEPQAAVDVSEPDEQDEQRNADFAAVERYASYAVESEAVVEPAAQVELAAAEDGQVTD